MPASVMNDEWNPTPDELRTWAYDAGATWPNEDWDLAVTRDDRSAAILQFATDLACPSRNFFLRCLYLLVGDAVRSNVAIHRREVVLDLLARIPDECPPDVARWAERSRTLLSGPSDAVDYDLWCAGGYALAERDND